MLILLDLFFYLIQIYLDQVEEAILKFVHTIVTYQTDINDLNDKLCTHINLLYVYRTLESELEALIL